MFRILASPTTVFLLAVAVGLSLLHGQRWWPFNDAKPSAGSVASASAAPRIPTLVEVVPLGVEGAAEPVTFDRRTGDGRVTVVAAQHRTPIGWSVGADMYGPDGTITVKAWQLAPGVPVADDADRQRSVLLQRQLDATLAGGGGRLNGPPVARTVVGYPAVEVANANQSDEWTLLYTYVFVGTVVIEVSCKPASSRSWPTGLLRACAAVLATLEVAR